MINTIEQKPWKILIVDDEADVHEITEMALKRLKYEDRSLVFIKAYSAAEAVSLLEENPDIAVALLDVVMENDTSGLDLVKTIREKMGNSNIRIIVRTGNPGLAPEESVTLNYDINDYRGKTELTAQSLRTMIITALRSYVALVTIKGLKQEINDTQKELIYSLGEIAESRSTDSSYHVKRVGYISAFLAEKVGFSPEEIEIMHLAASIHDVGKLAIDDSILNKPGRLNYEEFEQMKNHSLFGYELLKNSQRDLFKTAAIIAYEHHENYDGSGYPKGIKGEEIHLCSRIVAIVDVFDALATKRVYKEVWSQEEIISYLHSQRGIKFDPVLLDLFFENIDEINTIFRKYQ
ncbi:MAG: HD domain-containing phosphohydrolase [Mobilitalea sp.]